MDAILEPLMKSGKLVQYVRELNGFLQEEHVRRLAFRDWLPPGVKAEFINGKIVMHSPERLRHTDARQRLGILMRTFAVARAVGKVLDEKATVELDRNDVMPDVNFWRAEVAKDFDPEQMLYPAPTFVCEVLSPTTESRDRGVKFSDYARSGVAEYWLVHPQEGFVEQYVLRNGQFELLATIRSGTIASEAVPGFSIPIEAIFDDAANLAALRAILA